MIRFRFPDAPAFDETVIEIEAWWDRYVQVWTIQCKNAAGYQIGDASHAGTKEDAAHYVRSAAESHPAAKVVAPKSLRPYLNR